MATASAAGTRPASAGPTLLALFALVHLATIVVAGVVILGPVQDRVVRALDAAGDSAVGEAAAVVVVFGAVVSAVVALIAGVLALAVIPGVRRGRRRARITGLVTAALVGIWVLVLMVLNPRGGPVSLFSAFADTNDAMTAAELQDSINAALPSWYQPVTIAGITATLAVGLVAVLARSR
ncbi:MAG: hypothetical protein K6T92_08975 [Candidatus Rokubacteria bacterium]|nr:hypothetical protein [Candidatus Rokubacteria bacterium]